MAYLQRSPYENVFLAYLLNHEFSSSARERIMVATEEDAVIGVVNFGRHVALACESNALAAVAQEAKRHRGARMLFGPLDTVAAYWELVRAWHPRPRIVRERQFVMMVDRARLRSVADSVVEVRRARAGEWASVADASALMTAGELGYDPRSRHAAEFANTVKRMIEAGLWWVGTLDGRLCFTCNIGPWCRLTAQLQGIWTPPEFRGRGYATAALAAICRRLLDDTPSLSLFVNDFNAPAVALYRRIGFETVAYSRMLLF